MIPQQMYDIVRIIRNVANQRREAAGMDGRSDDGGARELEEQIKFYMYGASGQFPQEWRAFEKLLDPEYQDYLRLKSKFEK